MKQRLGFTLVEVLITLAVIGVVAAITLPSVIKNYRNKQLETYFKKADNYVSQILSEISYEYNFGNYDNFEMNGFCESSGICNEISDYFWNKLSINKCYNHAQMTNFKLKSLANADSNYGNLHSVWKNNRMCQLNNNIAVTPIIFNYPNYWYGMNFAVDTNGLYKGPNRIGYDVFWYTMGKKTNRIESRFCSPTGEHGSCYRYARMDKNPSDNASGYFKNLK